MSGLCSVRYSVSGGYTRGDRPKSHRKKNHRRKVTGPKVTGKKSKQAVWERVGIGVGGRGWGCNCKR